MFSAIAQIQKSNVRILVMDDCSLDIQGTIRVAFNLSDRTAKIGANLLGMDG